MTVGMTEQETVRALRRLSAKGVRSEAEYAALQALQTRGLVSLRADGSASLTALGKTHLRRALSTTGDFAAQHQERGKAILRDDFGTSEVTVNHDESPLSWLRHRRGRDGKPLIDANEFAAGERLRSDYSRGQIMPRVTANWSASVASGRRAGGIAELTEAAIGARHRVEKALVAVGPEFSGLLVDFCCFLKGLEEIERERQWPARSAKLVLRLGLSTLARHYGLGTAAHGKPRAGGIRHWGAEDYRPVID
jgi:Domain of unknown function (DUF6456)